MTILANSFLKEGMQFHPLICYLSMSFHSSKDRDSLKYQHCITQNQSTHLNQRAYPGLEVNFLVHLQNFAGKIFFHQQTGETTSKFFPFVWKTWMILTCKSLLVDIFIKITCILQVCEVFFLSPGIPHVIVNLE